MDTVRDFLAGGGEMGALMRAKDWSQTRLGPAERWPQSLRTIVGTCLNSRFPMLVWWGRDLVKLYNDAYRPILGARHPAALGAPGREVWPEIWNIVGPMLDGVLSRGEATWSEDIMLPLERKGFVEECYFTFSYSPIRDESGGIGGVFTAVTETTQQVLSARRLGMLSQLANATAGIDDERAVCVAATALLEQNDQDVSFSRLYLVSDDGSARPVSASPAAPAVEDAQVAEVARTGSARLIEAPPLPRLGSAGPALILPIARPGLRKPAGVLVAGLSPHLEFDDAYRRFLELLAGQLATAMASARALEEARRRAESLAELDRAKTASFSNVSHEETRLIREAERANLYRHFMQAPFPVCVFRGPEHVIELANPQMLRAWGKGAEVVGLPVLEALPQLHEQPFIGYLNEVFRTGIAHEGRAESARLPVGPAGELREVCFNFVYAPLRDTRGFVEGILVSAFDVTAQVLASQETERAFARAAASEKQFRELVDNLPELAWTARPDGYIHFYNRRWYEYTGTTLEQMEGWGWAAVHDPAKLPEIVARWQESLSTGRMFEFEFPIRRADGVYRWFLTRAIPLRDGEGRIVQWFGTNTDVDDVRRERDRAAHLAAELLAATERLDVTRRAARIGVFDWTISSGRVTWSPELYLLMGLAPDAIESTPEAWTAAVVEEDREPGWSAFRNAAAARDTRMEVEVRLRQPSGETRWVRLSSQIEYDAAGAPQRLLGAVIDIQALKEATAARARALEEEQRARVDAEAARARLHSLFLQAPAPICILEGPDHRYTLVNPSFAKLAGRADIMGKTVVEAFPELVEQGFLKLLDHVYATGETFHGNEIPLRFERRTQGQLEEGVVNLVYQAFRDLDGRISGILVIAFDVTDVVTARRASEHARHEAEAAEKAQREVLEFQERFVAILGHDLRNPLSAIHMAMGLLAKRAAQSSDAMTTRVLGRIGSSTRRMSRMIEQILDLSRSRIGGGLEISRAPMDLCFMLNEVVDELRTAYPSRTIQLRCSSALGKWDRDRLEQVFSNLVGNALQHGPADKPVTIDAREDGGKVRVEVHNEGPPIPEALRATLFSPFRRGAREKTSAMTAGLGLGLYISLEIVSAHGGDIECRSSLAEGTTFSVTLPMDTSGRPGRRAKP